MILKRTVLTLRGIQYAATPYIQMLQAVDAQTSMAESVMPGKTAALIGSCSPLRKRKLTCRTMRTILVLSASWADSSTTSACASGFTPRRAIWWSLKNGGDARMSVPEGVDQSLTIDGHGQCSAYLDVV